MPLPAASAATPAARSSHVGNRRRNGYELTQQRDMVPIALGAGLGAIVLHVVAWFCCPTLLLWDSVEKILVDDVKPEEEPVRVVVREKAVEEFVETEPEVPAEQELTQEMEQMEPEEIDILDMENIQELSITPGETNLALPQPEVIAEAPAAGDVINPEPIDVASLPTETPPPALIVPSEPAPVNSNDVVANITAQPDDVQEASELMEKSLRQAASDSKTPMPGDTRSLVELMGIENPGSRSGVARLGADVLFAYDKCQLKNSARITMLQLAALIHKNPTSHFVIEGHTDSFGGEDYNALLSLQRAAAVREWLMKNGVPVERVYIRPCGNNNPLVKNPRASKNAQSLNRRVEIHVRRADEQLPEGCVPHTVAVNTTTPVATQLANGVRVPEAYASAYGRKPAESPAGEGADKAASHGN